MTVPIEERAEHAGHSGAATATSVMVALVDLVTAFGFVVGFNQLATQSPVDALLPVALFSVGLAGLLSLPAALLGARRAPSGGPAAFLRPPALDAGFAAFAIGLLALAALGWRWGVAAQAALVAAQGVRLLLQAELGAVALVRRDPSRPDTSRLVLLAVEAVLLIGFAWAALADGSIRPFA
jgi:hypothetical protein